MKTTRRQFVRLGVGLGSSLVFVPIALRSQIAQAAPPQLSESDPAAVAVGYRKDASHVDKTKYPTWAASQKCSNCSLYQGDPNPGDPKSSTGGCTLFGDKQVAAAGWCNSWTNM